MKGLLLITLCALASTLQAKDKGMFFIENIGQVTDQFYKPRTDIDFSLQAEGISIFIGPGGIHYQFNNTTSIKADVLEKDMLPLHIQSPVVATLVNSHRIDLRLLGANVNSKHRKEGRLEYYERYYFPQLGDSGGLARSYSKIVYPDIYPNIDWVIYTSDGELEYDFVVKQGGKVSDIRMRHEGATNVYVDGQGDLNVKTILGAIKNHAPHVYQEDGHKIRSSYKVDGNIVSFDVADYSGILLIDPYIEWATYYGGGVADDAQSVVLDASGNVYIGGRAHSIGNIATTGAFDMSYADSGDAYIVKFDSNGVRLWATYYGSISPDWLFDLACDNQGHIFADGLTYSISDISTSGSDQPVYSGGGDAFLVKFDSAGTRLWATYFGGNSYDTPGSMACDETGNIYMGGMTASLNISTISAHQASFGGYVDGFIVKYNSSGTKIWCTYYGGVAYDQAWGLATSGDSVIYVGGTTGSPNNIATSGTYQPTKPNNAQHSAYIARFDTSGNRQWGTFFGGTSNIGGTRIDQLCCDNSGNIIVSGYTDDTSGMVTSGCHQSSYGGAGGQYTGDGIIAKFSPTGSRIWSTYFGGSADDILWVPVCNSSDEIYVVGRTQSPNNIAINAFQANFGGGGQSDFDGWVAKLSSGGACIWSTYLGGNKDDGFQNVTTTENNFLYITGYAASAPTTVGSHQPNYGGGQSDGYLIKFKDFPTGITPVKRENIDFNIYPNPNRDRLSLSVIMCWLVTKSPSR
ncbi:MAG TPA: SBBP repeat-containing protein [Flavipsychrobacter sp.]|nr:SBBP repeat-containing protein [Flavipsychrobacter sp.]